MELIRKEFVEMGKVQTSIITFVIGENGSSLRDSSI